MLPLLILTITEIGILLMKAERFEFVALCNLSNTEPGKETEILKKAFSFVSPLFSQPDKSMGLMYRRVGKRALLG